MPEVKRKVLGGFVLTLLLTTLGTPNAWAKITPDGSRETDTDVSADVNGDKLTSTAGAVVFDRSKNGSGQSAGPVTSTASNWTPPACYYAPK